MTLLSIFTAALLAAAGPPAAVAVSTHECSTAPLTGKRTFDVGPSRQYAELNAVPWLSLRAGDVVNIFYRPEPYRTKIGLRAQGTAKAPVIINGVTDSSCRRPVITGEGAATPTDLARREYFNRYTESLGVILLYRGPDDPWGYKPRFIQIKNLLITGAKQGNRYTSQSGAAARFEGGSAGIYAVTVEDLLVENCEISGNGNGIFVNTKNDSEEEASYRITIRRNKIHLNGNVGSYYEHNLYVQAVRALYEGNYIGQLIPGAEGSSLKDRSSGTIVRYNHIVAAARALDLVETEGGSTTVFKDPQYHDAWVYGNVIVSDFNQPGQSASNLIHWGGDNSPQLFRTGTLHFYHNTVITRGNEKQSWRISLFDLPSNDQKVELRSNVISHKGTSHLYLARSNGVLMLTGTNWISKGWNERAEEGSAMIRRTGTLLEGADPGLQVDFRPAPGSPTLDRGTPAPPALSGQWINQQYVSPAGVIPRSTIGAADDLGAFERGPREPGT